MPRRASKTHRREVQPDAVYNNRLVTQLINKVLLHGKKSLAERIVYGAFDLVAEKTGQDPLSVFKKAMDNVRPTLECKPKPAVPPRWPSAGSSTSPASARSTPWSSALLPRSWTLPRTPALPSSVVRTCTRWLSPTVPSPTIVGNRRDCLIHG